MNFHWDWYSRKGQERPQNQDYAGIALGNDFLFAVIADGVFSRPKSGELAKALVVTLVDRAIAQKRAPSSAEVQQWAEDAFYELKSEREPKSSSSFLAATFVRDQLLFAVHAGDCRVGTLTPHSEILWKTPVHSVATALQALPESQLRVHPARNQLTRSFGTKRYCMPETSELCCEYATGAVLATDGFWAELPTELQKTILSSERGDQMNFQDDVSCLSIHWADCPAMRTAAAENLYIHEEL